MTAEADHTLASQECHEATFLVLIGRLSHCRLMPESGMRERSVHVLEECADGHSASNTADAPDLV